MQLRFDSSITSQPIRYFVRKTRIQGDLIILGRVAPLQGPENAPAIQPSDPALDTTTLLARYAFSQALSRSTTLAVLEESLEDYLSSVAQLPHALERTGKPGLDREALIKKLGVLLKFRQGLNLNRENFSDTPDLYWAEPELEVFFKSMSGALEVKTRTNAVNEKITYATEASLLMNLKMNEKLSPFFFRCNPSFGNCSLRYGANSFWFRCSDLVI